MILIDFSAITIANVIEFRTDLMKKSPQEMRGILYHVILKSIVSYKKKYAKYGDVVIAVDSKNSWRKDVFPLYKANRKEKRDADDLDWGAVFEVIRDLEKEIELNMPWKLIKVDKCEADDIVACIIKHESNDIFAKDILIVSSDHDYVQLHQHENVKQVSTKTKNLMEFTKKEIAEKIIEHIVKGDSGDGVCNILSPSNSLVEGIRQKSVMKARLEEFYKLGKDACKDDFERENWDRNYTLVNFDGIPVDIQENVINKYKEPQTGGKGTAMKFFIAHALRNLMNDLQDI